MSKKKPEHLHKYHIIWLDRLAELKRFKKQYGHTMVGIKHKKMYPKLHRWVHFQREFWAAGKLYPKRADMLNKIKFVWNVKEMIWERMYAKAKQYYQKNGSINMTLAFMSKNVRLSQWITQQRGHLLHHRHLTPERIRKLKAIGFGERHYHEGWNDKYLLLSEFYRKHGHFNTRSDKVVHQWAKNQRQKKKSKRLPAKNIAKLNEINFPWKLPSPQ